MMADKYSIPFVRALEPYGLTWKNDEQGQAHCPAHEDLKESLHVTIKPDSKTGEPVAYAKCHARCSVLDILKKLNLTWSAMYVDKASGKKSSRGARKSSEFAGMMQIYQYRTAS